ncbi:hypothetical protein F8388_000858 [Cannabis sativa]|uniref:Uncharacterized protein n=1 Tax=Cannabis sativa TaxID=3483 RepID=A0A7J6FPQ3_CANSA|nr:hypothetical protein F8388_000858 [Cannabis sativa]
MINSNYYYYNNNITIRDHHQLHHHHKISKKAIITINNSKIMNVATPPIMPKTSPVPPPLQPPEKKSLRREWSGSDHHVAWTSVRQERWEGELLVDGDIPLWLLYEVRHAIFEMGRSSLTDNANTGVVKLGDGRVVCLTETQKGSIIIDPETLETVGKFEYSDSLGGLIHSAHPIVTETEFLTLLPDLISPGYLVVRMEPGSNERKVIGRVNCRNGPSPGWVHSFPVTEHYVVVPEMPLRYCAQNLLKAEPTPLYKFQWHPESKAFMHVMCKSSGKIVASVEVPLFITFHFINAYEEKDEEGRVRAIVADCCEHNADTTILDKLTLHNLRSYNGQHDVLPDARVGRFRIPLDGSPYGKLEAALDANEHGRGMDMCSINPSYLGQKYRYAYACGAQRPCNFPNTITKIDLVEKKAKNWYEEGVVPSEPYFVARPGATEEDDGVVISMISEKNGGGYALLLDASTFEEIARAKFPYGLPYGLHGCWVPNPNK